MFGFGKKKEIGALAKSIGESLLNAEPGEWLVEGNAIWRDKIGLYTEDGPSSLFDMALMKPRVVFEKEDRKYLRRCMESYLEKVVAANLAKKLN